MNRTQTGTTTEVSNRRRSQRVPLSVPVVARFHLLHRECVIDGETHIVNAHGGSVLLSVAPMGAGDIIILTNPHTHQSESCRVIRVEVVTIHPELSQPDPKATLPQPNSEQVRPPRAQTQSLQIFEVFFAFDRACPQFWPVPIPPTDWIEPSPDL
jgi:hypothetical protein